MSQKEETDDAWSPILMGMSAICALALVLVLLKAPMVFLFLFWIVPLILFAAVVWFCSDIIRHRARHALSVLAAVAIVVGIVLNTPAIGQIKDWLVFRSKLAHFERQVERARAQMKTPGPVQIVLDFQDRSLFLSANLYYIIYDETDGAGPYNSELRSYSGSSVEVPKNMRRLTGHFYDFTVSF